MARKKSLWSEVQGERERRARVALAQERMQRQMQQQIEQDYERAERRASQRANVKVSVLAAQIVEQVALHTTGNTAMPAQPAAGRHLDRPRSPDPSLDRVNGQLSALDRAG